MERGGEGFDNIAGMVGWENIIMSTLNTPANKRFEGMTVQDIAKARGNDPINCVCDMLIEENCAITMIDFITCEEDIARILNCGFASVISDSIYPASGRPHPRLYGTYARIIQRFVRERGDMTLAFGPLKPVGLRDERTGVKPFAVVQLRQDDSDGTLYNIVGFQTNLKFGEQRRVFGLIPGLEHAEYERYGVMHRNTFINSPGKLSFNYEVLSRPGLFFAGQMTGVEGYVESAGSGLVAGIALARELTGLEPIDFTRQTALGAMGHYVSEYCGKDFQPMNINFGIMDGMENAPRKKEDRYTLISQRAIETIDDIIENKM